jgi:hypothetical protein
MAAQADDSDYSATVLASHWFIRPQDPPQDPPHEPERRPEDATAVLPLPALPSTIVPDRVEGQVLRFGPGVPGAPRTGGGTRGTVPVVWHGNAPAPERRDRRRGPVRRYGPAFVVLLAVLAFLFWQRLSPGLAVEEVVVRTESGGPVCGGTADVVGLVKTNGRPGTLTYRWMRSDGTASGVLHEKVTEGQREARLHLLWTFHGEGQYAAEARLQITSPAQRTASIRFTYRCD